MYDCFAMTARRQTALTAAHICASKAVDCCAGRPQLWDVVNAYTEAEKRKQVATAVAASSDDSETSSQGDATDSSSDTESETSEAGGTLVKS